MATIKKKENAKDGRKPFFPKETRTTAGVLILTYGANSNYRKWSQELSDYMLTVYKFHSNFTVTDIYPSYPVIRAPTNQQLANDPLNQKRDEYLELCKQRLKNISNLEKDRYAMFAEIFKHLSETSKDKVKSHADYNAAIEDNRNPHLLWKTVRTVHTIQATGDPVGERNLQRLKLQKMRQSNTESLISFKVRMEEIYTSLQNLEHPVGEEEQVQEFLNRMDQSRFGTYLLQLRSHISLMHGNEYAPTYPANLQDCVTRITAWSESQKIQTEYSMQPSIKNATIFSTQQGKRNLKKKNNKTNKSQESVLAVDNEIITDSKNCKFPEIKCFNCNMYGHYAQDCTNKKSKRTNNNKKSEKAFLTHVNEIEVEKKINEIYITNHNDNTQYKKYINENVINDDYILLDTCASISIVRNADLLTNIKKTNKLYIIYGINGDTIEVNHEGELKHFGKVLFSKDAIANILALSRIEKDKTMKIKYKQGIGFQFTTINDFTYNFNLIDHGKYACNFKKEIELEQIYLSTIAENESAYSKREINNAKIARQLQKRLGYPTTESMVRMIRSATIKDIPITEQDVIRADIIYGKDISAIKGRMTKSKAKHVEYEQTNLQTSNMNQTLHADIMFVEGKPYLVSISSPLCITMVTELKDGRQFQSVKDAINSQVNNYLKKGFKINLISTDGEGAIAKLERQTDTDFDINICGPGQHNPIIEKKIRQIKERIRAVLHSLPYNLPGFLLTNLVNFVVSRINMLPTTTRNDNVSPTESFTGRKTNYEVDLRTEFGEYVQMYNPNNPQINNMQARTNGGIALNSTGNLQGSVLFFSLGTRRIVSRNKWISLPINEEVIDCMNDLAKHCRLKITKEPTININPESQLTNEIINDNVIVDALQIEPNELEQQNENDIEQLIVNDFNVEHEEELVDNDQNQIQLLEADMNEVNDQHDENNNIDEIYDHDDEFEIINPIPRHRHYLRNNNNINQDEEALARYFEHGLHITYKKAIEQFGEEATNASLLKEAEMMLTKNVWMPAIWGDLTREEKQLTTLRALTFYKDKWYPDATFEKLKPDLLQMVVNKQKMNMRIFILLPLLLAQCLLHQQSVQLKDGSLQK